MYFDFQFWSSLEHLFSLPLVEWEIIVDFTEQSSSLVKILTSRKKDFDFQVLEVKITACPFLKNPILDDLHFGLDSSLPQLFLNLLLRNSHYVEKLVAIFTH